MHFIINNKKNILFVILLLIFGNLFLLVNQDNNTKVHEDKINNIVDKKSYSIMVDRGNGYVEENVFPGTGYILDTNETICVDNSGNTLNVVPTYSSGSLTITSGKTAFCYLYFEFDSPIVGTIIHFTDDTNGINYRILKYTNDTTALVLRMNNDLGNMKFDLEEPYSNVYSGNNLDTYMNTTFYNSLNSNIKNVIVANNITQGIYTFNSGVPSGSYYMKGTYTDSLNSIVVNYYITLDDTYSVGERYVYALDLSDIKDYLGQDGLSTSALNQMFYNSSSYQSSSIWLRSANSSGSIPAVWNVFGNDGYLTFDPVNVNMMVRPAFLIELSNVNFEVVTS